MELNEAIYQRRAVRDYLDQPVSRSDIRDLINAAIQAPSAMNQQPWAFGVFQGKERLQGYAKRAKTHLLDTLSPSLELHPRTGPLADPDFNIFYNAGTLIVIYATQGRLNPAEDCCLAAENLMLAACARGLGTCPIGFARPWLELDAVKDELGVPRDHTAVFPIIVGHPAGKSDPVPRREAVILTWK